MTDPTSPSPTATYQRPRLVRSIDPQRINWLWRLVHDVARLEPNEVMAALHANGIPVSRARVESWLANDQTERFFPLSVAELEQNLRALLAWRARRATTPAAPGDTHVGLPSDSSPEER